MFRLPRHGGEPGGEVPAEAAVLGFVVLQIGTVRSLVEVEGVAEGVVVEPPVPIRRSAGTAACPTEPPYEGLPLGAGNDLRPLAELLQSTEATGPPSVVVLAGADPLPQGGPEGGGAGPGAETVAEAEAAAGVVVQRRRGFFQFIDRLRFLLVHSRLLYRAHATESPSQSLSFLSLRSLACCKLQLSSNGGNTIYRKHEGEDDREMPVEGRPFSSSLSLKQRAFTASSKLRAQGSDESICSSSIFQLHARIESSYTLHN